MFLILLILPIILFILSQIPEFIRQGVGKTLRRVGFWVLLALTELFSMAMLIFLFMSFTAPLSFSLPKLCATALSALGFILGAWLAFYVKRTKKLVAVIALSAMLALFLEGTVFNFRFWQTFDYTETDLTASYTAYGMEPIEGETSVYEPLSSEPYIIIRDINGKVNNIYVDIAAHSSKGKVVAADLTLYMTDESNANYLKLPVQTVIDSVEGSKYMHLLTNGSTKELKLMLSGSADTYTIEGIRINSPQSFSFKIIRAFAVFLILFLCWLLRPKSRLWEIAFSRSHRQRLIVLAVIVLQIALLFSVSFFNPVFQGNPAKHTAQYQELAEAFLDGRLYLEDEPPAFLAEMENPYDRAERAEMAALTGESVRWDAAYFEGKYYVYFGVVPVLMLYLPYRALTGTAMPNVFGIRFFTVFFVIGVFLLVAELIERYYKKKRIPFAAYILLCLILVNAGGGIFIAKRPDLYSIPILSGISFTLFGLYFWLLSVKKEGRVDPLLASLGSLCMALVAGCRPQLLLVSAFIFLIFWNSVFKERTLFSKKGFWSTVAVCLPYVIAAIGIMWYNNARFGSPFDFGASYNLTTNDVTGRGYRVERTGLALFTYFFQLPNITASFPFLRSVNIDTNYLGLTVTEPMFGGIFTTIPLLWCFALLPFVWRKTVKGHRLCLCLLPVGLAFVIGVFNGQAGGLLQRYVYDFAFLAILGAICLMLYVFERSRGAFRLYANAFLCLSAALSFAYCFMCIFAKYGTEIYIYNPRLFGYVSELVQFW